MKLIILCDGVYNDQFHRAQQRKAGEEHETAPDYGVLLVRAGMARTLEEKASSELAVELRPDVLQAQPMTEAIIQDAPVPIPLPQTTHFKRRIGRTRGN